MKSKLMLATTLALLVSVLVFSPASADVWVRGYYKTNGTYAAPYVRSDPDGIRYNNYSYPGNYNPYTGKTAGGSSFSYSYSPSYSYYSYRYPSYSSYQGYDSYSGLNSYSRYNSYNSFNYGSYSWDW